MVNENRIEKKLAGLLVNNPTSSRKGSTAYKQKEREIRKFKKEHPAQFRGRFFQLVKNLREFDAEMTRQAQAEIDRFNASFGPKKSRRG